MAHEHSDWKKETLMSKLNGAKFINLHTGEECVIHCDGQRNENEPRERKENEEQAQEEFIHKMGHRRREGADDEDKRNF